MNKPCPTSGKCHRYPERPEQQLQQIKAWLSECRRKHPKCLPVESRWTPSRLLRVEEESVRLVVPEPGTDFAYVALSHRWPNSRPKTILRVENLEAFKTAVPLDEISTAFREVFRLVRSLDMRYIWIDSLCIIQDDEGMADFKKEALLMHKIYKHARLTIALTGLKNSDSSTRNQHCTNYINNTYLADAGWLIRDETVWSEVVVDAPLSSRGWTFQERFLSRRLLHLGGKQMAWECHTCQATESLPLLNSNNRTLNDRRSGLSDFWDGVSSKDPLLRWREAVVNYSNRQLTKREDVLIAIDGIASVLREATQDRYMAGLWSTTVALELAWSRHEYYRFHHPYSRDASYAPTWSWASVQGAITYNTDVVVHNMGMGHRFYLHLNDGAGIPPVPLVSLRGHRMNQDAAFPMVQEIFLEGALYSMCFSGVNPDGSVGTFTLDSSPLEADLIAKGIMDTDFDYTLLLLLARSGRILFLPTMRTLGHLVGIIITPSLAPSGVYRRIGSLRIDTERQTYGQLRVIQGEKDWSALDRLLDRKFSLDTADGHQTWKPRQPSCLVHLEVVYIPHFVLERCLRTVVVKRVLERRIRNGQH
jgi:hypothetical protein